jgi:hypothetical protein
MPVQFPEYGVILEPGSPSNPAVPLPYPDNLGMRTKLGGMPDWIQGAEVPCCSNCTQPMSFVAQIDSLAYSAIDPTNTYMFGDVGMLYLFYCVDCHTVSGLEQSY